MLEYTLIGKNQAIYTDFAGTISLMNYYNYAKQYSNCWITLNFDSINFIDANLSAFLFGIIYHLKKTRNVKTFVDFQSIGQDLNVLKRNGFTYFIAGKNYDFKPYDFRDTTIPLMSFSKFEVDAYVNYIERDFLHQRGLKKIKFDDKERIVSSYLEIFDNVGIHANTDDPIFVCGQYFPKQSELKLTLVDLGDGFLRKIAEFTKNNEKISKGSDAVIWAIRGNSTKKEARGGTGLRDIFKFCNRTGGSLQIVTDDCYYNLTSKTETTFKIPRPFLGATIHLTFRYLYN